MKPKQRWLILGALLLATLAAAHFAEDDEPVTDKSKRRSGSVPQSRAATSGGEARRAIHDNKLAELPAAGLEFPEPTAAPEAEESAGIDPFRSKSWYVAPPPPPPPRPTAPPLPFQYLGKLVEGSETRVFLNYQGAHLIARVGDVINGQYRVEEVVGSRMTFLYQPLKEMQVLTLGADR